MIHFTAEEWFEFARDSALAEQRLSMHRHLEQGCDACRKLLGMWQEILAIGAREASFRPPGEAVHFAKAAFGPRERVKWFPMIAEAARLIFDSMLDPIPSAIRGAVVSTQHFLQEAKPFVVDLQVNNDPARKRIHLIGQVLNSAQRENVSEVEVFVLNGEDLVANVMSNKSGEFELEFREDENLQVFVDVRGRKVIEVFLSNSAAAAKNERQ
jgi:hypothetical protein